MRPVGGRRRSGPPSRRSTLVMTSPPRCPSPTRRAERPSKRFDRWADDRGCAGSGNIFGGSGCIEVTERTLKPAPDSTGPFPAPRRRIAPQSAFLKMVIIWCADHRPSIDEHCSRVMDSHAPAEAIRPALTLRDLTDLPNGSHAMQLVVEEIEGALARAGRSRYSANAHTRSRRSGHAPVPPMPRTLQRDQTSFGLRHPQQLDLEPRPKVVVGLQMHEKVDYWY